LTNLLFVEIYHILYSKLRPTSIQEKHGVQLKIRKIKEKKQALSLAKDCYSMKLDLLTNATVVDDAIRFVTSNKFKDGLRPSGDRDEVDKEKSKEPDYDEDKDQLEEEQEEEGGGITTNSVF
jgi:hypothetical protein